MAINLIQFQKGLSLVQFWRDYGTHAQCEAALMQARWPHGYRCPRCEGAQAIEFRRGQCRYWQCQACCYQSSLTAGTMLQQTRLPLTTWFLAIYLVTQSKTNIAALALRRHLGVAWKTAWLLRHKLMETMHQREVGQELAGDEIVVDDAFLGGERTGGTPGRGSENKVPFVAAVAMRGGWPQRVRFDPVAGFSFEALKPWAAQALAPGSAVTSDGLLGFGVLRQLGFKHNPVKSVRGKAGCEVEPFKWLNVLLGNLKTALTGTYHAFKFAEYAHRYLAEAQYRFNRRVDLPAMRPRLAFALMRTRPCPQRLIQMGTEGTT